MVRTDLPLISSFSSIIVLEAFVHEYGLIEHDPTKQLLLLSICRPPYLFVICSTHIIKKLFRLTDRIQILFNGDITIKGWLLYFHPIVPLLLIILAIIPHRNTMIPKDPLCILLIRTILFVVVLLLVPVWTMIGRTMRLVITSLFVIAIRVSVKQGGKCFLNLV